MNNQNKLFIDADTVNKYLKKMIKPTQFLGGVTGKYTNPHNCDFFNFFNNNHKKTAKRVGSIVGAPISIGLNALRHLTLTCVHLLNVATSILTFNFHTTPESGKKAFVSAYKTALALFMAAISPFTNAIDVLGGLGATAIDRLGCINPKTNHYYG